MPTTSRLLLPPRDLSNCIAGCILRDTRGTKLSDVERLNYFPASPLFSITLALHWQLHVSDKISDIDTLRHLPTAGKWMIERPKNAPFCSWSPGPVFALTIGFFPDAWQRLGGTLDGTSPSVIEPALQLLEDEVPSSASPKYLPQFWQEMSAVWHQTGDADWAGSQLLTDWVRHLSLKLAHSGSGRSLRSAQRRLQRWTGQNQKSLNMFAKIEKLHRLSLEDPNASPAEIAADAGFSDQSHMGRSLKRMTGFSPASLNQRVLSEESFWCYRLLGERF